ncbi:MAG TPA: hypothetical protein VG796_06785 [Verrucomicrobiales bacterium]|nr:hypothetical protein [Verrucomicrobiales bacterium]
MRISAITSRKLTLSRPSGISFLKEYRRAVEIYFLRIGVENALIASAP